MYLSKLGFKNKSKIQRCKMDKMWQNIESKDLHLQKLYFRKDKMSELQERMKKIGKNKLHKILILITPHFRVKKITDLLGNNSMYVDKKELKSIYSEFLFIF